MNKLSLVPDKFMALPAVRYFNNESGKVGYILAWLLGVPAWLLLMIFLIRGH